MDKTQRLELIKKAYIENTNKKEFLTNLCKSTGLTKTSISRIARENGWSNRKRKTEPSNIICQICNKHFKVPQGMKRKVCGVECGIKLNSKMRTGGHIWANRPHPKGMLGKTHTPEYRKEISKRITKMWKDPKSVFNSEEIKQKQSNKMMVMRNKQLKENPQNQYSRTLKDWRTIGGQRHFFRSKWEINIAYYLEWLKMNKKILNWDYECETFWFEKIKRGVRSYTPDFKVTELNGSTNFIEVKGWMDNKSKTKLKRMSTYYPNIKINLYDEDVYKSLKKQVSRLCNWE